MTSALGHFSSTNILQGVMHNRCTAHFQQHKRLNFPMGATPNVVTWSSSQQKFHYRQSLNVHYLWNQGSVHHIGTMFLIVFVREYSAKRGGKGGTNPAERNHASNCLRTTFSPVEWWPVEWSGGVVSCVEI